jgi:hypothetical protein
VVPPPDDASIGAHVAALVVYIVLGYFLKSIVLNWIVGPLFLLVVLYLVPRVFEKLR